MQVLSGGELFLAPHVSTNLNIELLSRGVQEKLLQFSSTWSPPLAVDQWQCRNLSIRGLGWLHTAGDIVIPGLGFLSVTGSGDLHVEVYAPSEIDLYTRPSWIETTPVAAKWS
jgi:hypothetical protein